MRKIFIALILSFILCLLCSCFEGDKTKNESNAFDVGKEIIITSLKK